MVVWFLPFWCRWWMFPQPTKRPSVPGNQDVVLVSSHLLLWQVGPLLLQRGASQVLQLCSSALRIFFPCLLPDPTLHKGPLTLPCQTPSYLQPELLPQLLPAGQLTLSAVSCYSSCLLVLSSHRRARPRVSTPALL